MDLHISQYVRDHLIASGESVRVGPFVCRLRPGDPSPGYSYAVPDAGADPTPAQIGELIEVYRAHDRKPRLEFVPAVAPKVQAALAAAGFTVEHAGRLMACSPAERRDVPPPDGVHIVDDPDEDLWFAAATVQHAAFGDGPPDREGASRNLRHLTSGGAVAVAVEGDAVVGAGAYVTPHGGTTELVGIAVAEAQRRRGIAGALTAYLTRHAHERDTPTTWLDPADDGAGRVYARAGYRVVGASLHMSRD